MPLAVNWSQEYQRKCFDAWYLNGKPNLLDRIREIIPEENGKKPSTRIIGRWINSGAWDILADELDARVEEQANLALVDQKVIMLKRHQEQAAKVQVKALEYLMQEGFDTSASAVQALFRGAEEERKTAGFSDLLERLDKATDNDVRNMIITMIQRASDNNQIVEGDANDLAGEIDTVSIEDDEEQ